MPKLSIITPVYNTANYLPACIESALGQTFRDLELILVDDGSTDGSGKICDDYAKKDPRVTVIHKKNGGVATARNAGLDTATGDFIGWVDSDDAVSPVMYQLLLEAADTYGADIVQCENKRSMDLLVHDIDQPLPLPEVTDGLGSLKRVYKKRYANHMSLWSKIFRRELFDGIRFTPGRAFEDDEMVPRLFYRGRVNVFYDLPLYRYTLREGSIVISPKTEDVVALAKHHENRMLWYRELDEELYMLQVHYFFQYLKMRLCQESFRSTAVQDQAAAMLKKHKKLFFSIAHHYDKLTILMLYCGKGMVQWVARNDFAPFQNILAKIKDFLHIK